MIPAYWFLIARTCWEFPLKHPFGPPRTSDKDYPSAFWARTKESLSKGRGRIEKDEIVLFLTTERIDPFFLNPIAPKGSAGISRRNEIQVFHKCFPDCPIWMIDVSIHQYIRNTGWFFSPKIRRMAGFLKSVSKIRTFFPDWAKEVAKLAAMNVFPSRGPELVTRKNFLGSPRVEKRRFVLMVRKASAIWE